MKLFLKNMRQQFDKSTKRSRPKGKDAKLAVFREATIIYAH